MPTITAPPKAKRAIGIVRVSRVGDRTGTQFVSPSDQAERIAAACKRDGLQLLETVQELDVSGGTPLARRDGLRRAVEMIEAGDADTLVVAFFDRLFRSLKVQLEVVERVEAAGGTIVALDVGTVGGSAAQTMSAHFLGAVAQYHRTATAERTAEAKSRAIARGVPTFPVVRVGYRHKRDAKGNSIGLEPDENADLVREAFRLRASGASLMTIRAHLSEQGLTRSLHAVESMLGSRFYLGELKFGELVNTASHTPIVDSDTFARVQKMKLPRGRKAQSERLLARLGVLRCASCGGRLSVGSSSRGDKRFPFYRCSPTGTCTNRVSISATIAEAVVTEAVQDALAGVEGRATIDQGIADAQRAYEQAARELDAAVEAFTGLEDVAAARARLTALRDARDQARNRLEELDAANQPALTVSAQDWDMLTIDERRALIRAVIDSATVAPGRGPDRITITTRL